MDEKDFNEEPFEERHSSVSTENGAEPSEYEEGEELEQADAVEPSEVREEEIQDEQQLAANDGVHGAGEEQLEFAAPADVEPVPSLKNWYIIHAYSGFENKVAESLKTRAQAFGFAERLGQILIPTEEVIELRNGKKVTSKRMLYPGYVLVEMEMDDELWHAVKSTPRVTGELSSVSAGIERGSSASEDDLRKERDGEDRRWSIHKLLRESG